MHLWAWHQYQYNYDISSDENMFSWSSWGLRLIITFACSKKKVELCAICYRTDMMICDLFETSTWWLLFNFCTIIRKILKCDFLSNLQKEKSAYQESCIFEKMGNGKRVDIKWHWIAYINICLRIVYVWYKARISIFQKTWYFLWQSIFANIIFIINLDIKDDKKIKTQHYPGMRNWNQFLHYFLSWTQCFARFTVWIELPSVPTFFSFLVFRILVFVFRLWEKQKWDVASNGKHASDPRGLSAYQRYVMFCIINSTTRH